MTSKIICPCGSIIKHNYFRIHIYSYKHLNYLYDNDITDYADISNDIINQELYDLDENKLNMKDINYIEECNKLLKRFKENPYLNLIEKLQENNRLYNKIISEITYKNNPILIYQKYQNIYFNYYLINQKIFIIKIDYFKFILNNSFS